MQHENDRTTNISDGGGTLVEALRRLESGSPQADLRSCMPDPYVTTIADQVEIRAFRGSRRTSVYRKQLLTGESFARILAVARRLRLALLSSLDRLGSHELGKRQARTIASEATRIRASGELPDLDDDLIAFAEIARWCAHASGNAWMKIATS
jgi:hypothetical protein